MNTTQINTIEKHSEINYLIDSENFISQNNHIDFSKFNNNSIIFFEYTSDFYQLKNYLNNNNIKYTLLIDNTDLQFIIIK